MPMTESQRNKERKKRYTEAGLVKISPTYWVHADKREHALKLVNKILTDPDLRKPFDRYGTN